VQVQHRREQHVDVLALGFGGQHGAEAR